MIVRALSPTGDWTFGKGKNDYLSGNPAVAQNIQTRLNMILGECFFATTSGVDWLNIIGSKNQIALNFAVSTCILNTAFVTGIFQISSKLVNRIFSLDYSVITSFSTITDTFQYDTGLTG